MFKYILVLLLVFKQHFLFKKQEETDRNSGFSLNLLSETGPWSVLVCSTVWCFGY